jgi:hypothetical protein
MSLFRQDLNRHNCPLIVPRLLSFGLPAREKYRRAMASTSGSFLAATAIVIPITSTNTQISRFIIDRYTT